MGLNGSLCSWSVVTSPLSPARGKHPASKEAWAKSKAQGWEDGILALCWGQESPQRVESRARPSRGKEGLGVGLGEGRQLAQAQPKFQTLSDQALGCGWILPCSVSSSPCPQWMAGGKVTVPAHVGSFRGNVSCRRSPRDVCPGQRSSPRTKKS